VGRREIANRFALRFPPCHELICELVRFQAAHKLCAWLSSVELDRNDMADYTEKVLLFWRSNAPKFPAWGRLTRVFLSMAPSSAAVERIFSLCNHMFGDAQLSALADYVQGSLMLRANKRFHLLG
jgi:hypothetical protein